jgi:hypothetical protein
MEARKMVDKPRDFKVLRSAFMLLNDFMLLKAPGKVKSRNSH